ncbi:sulfurtransferase [Saccharospirillum impatiens]|uniref:sulfurtransferase n=1 Tax=Saccharospirillum impatiens TaxID=169438 RepID=UPI000405D1F3|nr:sulfurtransferase [Saccharospirillum impatiens]
MVLRSVLASAALSLASGLAIASTPLVSADWLKTELNNSAVTVLDIRSADAFADAHVPGSVFQTYGDWRSEREGVTGNLPELTVLAQMIGNLGIDNDDHVVIVPPGENSSDFGGAARVYWTFKVLGHDSVSILNGGYKGWVQQGYEVTSAPVSPAPAEFEVNFQSQYLATTEDVVANLNSADVQFVDARPSDFYTGQTKSGSARVGGTLPGSINLQEATLLDTSDGVAYFLTQDRVRQLAEDATLKLDAGRTVTFCNTGHWAATDWFALSEIAGLPNVAMYDGSMTAWTQDPDRPVQTEKRGLGRLLGIFGG